MASQQSFSDSDAPLVLRPVDGDGAGTTTARHAFFDNAKILAIVLVVCGHTWGPLSEDVGDFRVLRSLYMVVYLFHMPLFIVICG